jgi:lysophospholipase L1-like esterase
MWRAWKGTWFASEQSNQVEICSIFERLSKVTPISAIVHASARAKVDAGGSRTWVDLLTNTRPFSYQVDEVLLGEFPDLLLVWIGHNNIDWRSRFEIFNDESCEILSTEFIKDYRKQMERLLKDALTSKKRIVIIVYGLINFESFFEARAQAEQRRQTDANQFPYLETGHDHYPSMRPEHRSGMSELAQRCNERLEEMCNELNKAVLHSDILIVYSDALSKAKIREADMLHQSDAWHPSSAGHRVLAQSAYEPIKEQLSYLGWEPES